MTDFPLHDPSTAPDASKAMLEDSAKTLGMIPNLHRAMAESPELLNAYKHLHTLFLNTSFTATEQNVIWLTINVEHACHYCVPAHTAIAHSMKVDPKIIESLRQGQGLSDAKLEALRVFTLQVVRQRGDVSPKQVDTFLSAGYSRKQVLEILLAVAQKVMSNYLNHIVQTPIDEPFERFAWQPGTAA